VSATALVAATNCFTVAAVFFFLRRAATLTLADLTLTAAVVTVLDAAMICFLREAISCIRALPKSFYVRPFYVPFE
jgi:hypothetical protein